MLKNYPANKRIVSTAKRLREKEDNDEDDSREYAIKKRKFLIETMDNCDPPSYENAEEEISSLYRNQRNTISNNPMISFVQGKTCKR